MRIKWGVSAGAALLGLVFVQLVVLTATYAGQSLSSAILNAAVPGRYRSMLEAAAGLCRELPAPVFAAQLQAESAFDPNAVSYVGAMGLAQFMPGTWAQWGRDADGDGRASPFDPADAIDAQVRFMCDLHRTARRSGIRGDPVSLALAGYNAGWGAVRKHGGIPPFAETRGYVARITDMIGQFTATVAQAGFGTGADFLPGGPNLPRSNPRSAAQALTWAASQDGGPAAWYQLCLRFVANAYGWRSSGVAYAIDHFYLAPAGMRHPGNRNPPPGALLFWDTGHRAGHVAIALGSGLIASNDIESPGRISVVPATAPELRWGARYLGWTAPYFPHAR